MRKLLLVAATFAVSCGGGSSSNNGPGPLTGTFGGHTYAASSLDVKALVVGTGSNACTQIPSMGSAGIKAIALEVTTYANACGDFGNQQQCAFQKNAETVTVLVAKLNPVPVPGSNPAEYAEPSIPAGDYAIAAVPVPTAPPDAQGQLIVGYAQATATDATCNGGQPTPVKSSSGTIHFDQAIAGAVTGPITGNLTVHFSDGSSLSGKFSASLCTETLNICQLVTDATVAFGLSQDTMLYCAMPGTCPP